MASRSQKLMQFRPKTYWVYDDPLQRVQATVKGEVRRILAAAALEGDPVGFTDPHCFDPSLDDEERSARGRAHPMLMGGEYLPDLLPGEVEIARVCFASVTGDVTSIRARWEEGKIRYRVVDEYWDDDRVYTVYPESSDLPLTLGELVDLIDTADDSWGGEHYPPGLVLPAILLNQENGSGDPEDLLGFVTVSSPFYPELGPWYERWVQGWCDEILRERRRDERAAARQAARREREERRKRRQEDELIRVSPPKAPGDFPARLPVNGLTRVDLALLKKWVAALPGIQPASVSWEPPRVSGTVAGAFRGLSPIRYLFIDWTVDGTRREYRVGAPFPTVEQAFAAWAELAGVALPLISGAPVTL